MHGGQGASGLNELDQLSTVPFAPHLWGPASAERKVRGQSSSSRLSTGVAAEVGVGMGAVEGNHVGVKGTAGGRG